MQRPLELSGSLFPGWCGHQAGDSCRFLCWVSVTAAVTLPWQCSGVSTGGCAIKSTSTQHKTNSPGGGDWWNRHCHCWHVLSEKGQSWGCELLAQGWQRTRPPAAVPCSSFGSALWQFLFYWWSMTEDPCLKEYVMWRVYLDKHGQKILIQPGLTMSAVLLYPPPSLSCTPTCSWKK